MSGTLDTFSLIGGVLWDGTGAAPRENAALHVAGGRIAAVAPGSEFHSDAILDVAGCALLPGLIDLHLHFGAATADDVGRDPRTIAREHRAYRPRVRRALLGAGVTTVRSVGDVDYAIASLRRLAPQHGFVSPRIHCAGPVFTAPGGHPVSTVYANAPWLADRGARQVTTAAEARAEAAALAEAGMDGLKAVYSGSPRLDRSVLHALGEEAHRRGLWFAVHTATVEEVTEAVRAGATSVEHGVTSGELLSETTVAAMASAGVAYVPTMAVVGALRAASLPGVLENVRRAHRGGVRIGLGTDTQGPAMRFGDSVLRELTLLVAAGLSPSEALIAATRDAATVLGERDLGTLEPGRLADVVVVDGRPWERIEDIARVRLVVQGGRIVHGLGDGTLRFSPFPIGDQPRRSARAS
jgi:enamidase